MTLEDFNDLCEKEGTGDLLAVMDDHPSEMTELFETGSVTIRQGGRDFVISIKIEETGQ